MICFGKDPWKEETHWLWNLNRRRRRTIYCMMRPFMQRIIQKNPETSLLKRHLVLKWIPDFHQQCHKRAKQWMCESSKWHWCRVVEPRREKSSLKETGSRLFLQLRNVQLLLKCCTVLNKSRWALEHWASSAVNSCSIVTFNSLVFDIFHILTFKFHLILYFVIHSC